MESSVLLLEYVSILHFRLTQTTVLTCIVSYGVCLLRGASWEELKTKQNAVLL